MDFPTPPPNRDIDWAAREMGECFSFHLVVAKAVAQRIRSNRSLWQLDIRKNGIGIYGLKCVAEALAENETLQELVHDSTRVAWLKLVIRQRLGRNREGKTMLTVPEDVAAIRSVYR